MKVLIIEDDPHKLSSIRSFLMTNFPFLSLFEKVSYQSGLLAMLRDNFDLIILDMQLPNYDIKSGEDGYKPRPMAGRDILREIKRKKILTQVLIITQYESFGEYGKLESVKDWDAKFAHEFHGIYLQTIQYKVGSDSWKDLLNQQINMLSII